MRKLELLAPARNLNTGRIAILAGADAVYIGAPAFGARASATNSIGDIKELVRFAHRFRAKVYVTLNTILFDNEIEEARRLVCELYESGVDALIIQDMAYLMMDIPSIALHASTQCDIRTPEKAKFLADSGFSQLVLPREFSLTEIKDVAEAVDVPVEVFVHGALCVSYSGDCQAGAVAMGRSANRGVCPQMCRLKYELTDKNGKVVSPSKHYLSLKDLNQSASLKELIDAGATSFKIEGRLKDERYVANVTAEYSRLLNQIIEHSDGVLSRTSFGRTDCGFTPNLLKTFNRGYTSYFLTDSTLRIANIDTPKFIGTPVGKVKSITDTNNFCICADLHDNLANGDGLAYFDKYGEFHGFRLNRVEGDKLYPATPVEDIYPGCTLYRNYDKNFLDRISTDTGSCIRTISVEITLDKSNDNQIVISAKDERGISAELSVTVNAQDANTPQEVQRRKVFTKTGGTIYRVSDVIDKLGNIFIPASVLTEIRRQLLDTLDKNAESSYTREYRKNNTLCENQFSGKSMTYHDNVANKLATDFYESHCAKIIQPAIEVHKPDGDIVVMTTRYCIRKELGACLKESQSGRLPSPLFLKNDSGKYRLDFDCKRCGMSIVKCK